MIPALACLSIGWYDMFLLLRLVNGELSFAVNIWAETFLFDNLDFEYFVFETVFEDNEDNFFLTDISFMLFLNDI